MKTFTAISRKSAKQPKERKRERAHNIIRIKSYYTTGAQFSVASILRPEVNANRERERYEIEKLWYIVQSWLINVNAFPVRTL